MTAKEIYDKHEEARRVLDEQYGIEIDAARQREFPIGTKVLFPHGIKKVEGKVIGHSPFEWQRDRVVVASTSSGGKATHEKHVWELEKL